MHIKITEEIGQSVIEFLNGQIAVSGFDSLEVELKVRINRLSVGGRISVLTWVKSQLTWPKSNIDFDENDKIWCVEIIDSLLDKMR